MREPLSEKEQIIRRLRLIQGQTRGLQHMVGSGRNCQEILVQIASVKAALEQVSLKLAEYHLKVCFRELTTSPGNSQPKPEPEQVFEVIRLLKKH
ncbi:MAG: metal-sensitive transcriptional regulator [Chloroflexi bacterium]|nr:metal-sensitive transcriptional regulator [Chloroflexota bacterium]OJV99058.1 MAG: hypothetical protein BGO39_16470 [Chloroflexi bacterium 54-19]